MKYLATLALLTLTFPASACLCLTSTNDWWNYSDSVSLIRVDQVRLTAATFHGEKCEGRECILMQKALFSTVETFKGELKAPFIVSSFEGKQCAIPLIAGAYYVIFASKNGKHVGVCNTAGPYVPRYPYKGNYPTYLDNFLASLRAKKLRPGTPISARPNSTATF